MLERLRPHFPVRLPAAYPGMRIGLYGGSFNPPHAGHVLVSKTALTRLDLDCIWWIVTPGNPLKDTGELSSLEQRIGLCRDIITDPRMHVTSFEEQLGSPYTLHTLRYVTRRYPAVSFIWIMGGDNLRTFHLWQGWQDIAALMPIAVIDRPTSTLTAPASRMAYVFRKNRLPSSEAAALVNHKTPCWVYLYGPRSPLSSSRIRHSAIKKI